MKRTSLVTLLALGLSFVSSSGALAQRTSKRNVPVTTTIEGSGAFTDPTVFNYRIQSDLLGPYHDGVDSVVSQLQEAGDYEVNTLASTSRSMLVDLRDPVPNSNPSPPFSLAQVPAKVETKSYILYGSGKVRGMMGLNSTLITPLLVRFDLNGIVYRLWMNSTNYPETNYALATCTGVVDPNNPDTSQCNQWRIEPSVTQPDGQKKNIARLVRVYTKGKITEENHGDFYVSFSVNVTNP